MLFATVHLLRAVRELILHCFDFLDRGHICLPLGVVQGMITGIRGLCNGLGPALYGFVFYLFHVELTDTDGSEKGAKSNMANPTDEVSTMRSQVSIIRTYSAVVELERTVSLPVFSECHHPRSPLPVRCVLGAAVSAGRPVYPRAHRARNEAWRL